MGASTAPSNRKWHEGDLLLAAQKAVGSALERYSNEDFLLEEIDGKVAFRVVIGDDHTTERTYEVLVRPANAAARKHTRQLERGG